MRCEEQRYPLVQRPNESSDLPAGLYQNPTHMDQSERTRERGELAKEFDN